MDARLAADVDNTPAVTIGNSKVRSGSLYDFTLSRTCDDYNGTRQHALGVGEVAKNLRDTCFSHDGLVKFGGRGVWRLSNLINGASKYLTGCS